MTTQLVWGLQDSLGLPNRGAPVCVDLWSGARERSSGRVSTVESIQADSRIEGTTPSPVRARPESRASVSKSSRRNSWKRSRLACIKVPFRHVPSWSGSFEWFAFT